MAKYEFVVKINNLDQALHTALDISCTENDDGSCDSCRIIDACTKLVHHEIHDNLTEEERETCLKQLIEVSNCLEFVKENEKT